MTDTSYAESEQRLLRASAIRAQLRRPVSDSDIANARARHAAAEAALAEVRDLPPSERIAALLAVLEPIVSAGEAALDRFERGGEVLAEAEQAYLAAQRAQDLAMEQYKRGALQNGHQLFLALEDAKAAVRWRSQELQRAQRQVNTVPSCGLPRAARDAASDTSRLADGFEQFELDWSSDYQRPTTDVVRIAAEQGFGAAREVATWWVLYESRAIAALKKDARTELARLFAHRWEHFVRGAS